MHSVVRRRKPSFAEVLVVIVAAVVILAATLLTFELMLVESGLDDSLSPSATSHSRTLTL